tara:strand:- start:30350 stop:30631 length:282 start_codon:yes stop_codon:yes gene_type:complete
MNSEKPIRIDINGVLDLHPFSPEDLSTLIDEYIEACLDKKIYHLRIIHGKGIGNIRRSVHSLLDRNPYVISYQLADASGGSWGATIVNLESNS